MSMPPIDLIANACWKAQNNADPSTDFLAAHLSLQEVPKLRLEANCVLFELEREGYVLAPRALRQEVLEQVVREAMPKRSADAALSLAGPFGMIYEAAMREYARDLDDPMIRSIMSAGMAAGLQRRRGRLQFDPFERRLIERSVTNICEDLAANGFRALPARASDPQIDSILRDQRTSTITLIFGENRDTIGGIYQRLVDRQRIQRDPAATPS